MSVAVGADRPAEQKGGNVHQVPDENVLKRQEVVNGSRRMSVPVTWRQTCPSCFAVFGFTIAAYDWNSIAQKRAHAASCPGCEATAEVWIIDPERGGQLWVHPSPTEMRQVDLEGVPDVSNGLRRDYEAAVASFEHGLWRPAAQSARLVLEAIVTSCLGQPDRLAPLDERLRSLADAVDLAGPLNDAAEAIRPGGNLAAHFDDDRDFDQNAATEMIELINYLLDYLFVLPNGVQHLRASVELDVPLIPTSVPVAREADVLAGRRSGEPV